MSESVVVYLIAFSLGLLGSAHCIGMCGGIMGALSFAVSAQAKFQRLALLLLYNLGRLSIYGLMGLLVGFLGSLFNKELNVLRVVAGVLLIAMGLYLTNWWRGLVFLEKLGAILWRHIQPYSRYLLPVRAWWQALLLGVMWGWLPCGLIYSTLTYAASQGQPSVAAGVMLVFGLGTMPALMTGSLVAEHVQGRLHQQLIQNRSVRYGFGVAIMLFGVWTLWGSLQHWGHVHHP